MDTNLHFESVPRLVKPQTLIAIGCALLTLSLSGCDRKQRTPTPKTVVSADFTRTQAALREDVPGGRHSASRITSAFVGTPSGR